MLQCQGAQNIGLSNLNVHSMITMHAHSRQTDRWTNIMAIAQRFILMNASRAKNQGQLVQLENSPGSRCLDGCSSHLGLPHSEPVWVCAFVWSKQRSLKSLGSIKRSYIASFERKRY